MHPTILPPSVSPSSESPNVIEKNISNCLGLGLLECSPDPLTKQFSSEPYTFNLLALKASVELRNAVSSTHLRIAKAQSRLNEWLGVECNTRFSICIETRGALACGIAC